jgi:hypothetical protein
MPRRTEFFSKSIFCLYVQTIVHFIIILWDTAHHNYPLSSTCSFLQSLTLVSFHKTTVLCVYPTSYIYNL